MRDLVLAQVVGRTGGHLVAELGQAEARELSVEDAFGVEDLTVTKNVNAGCRHV